VVSADGDLWRNILVQSFGTATDEEWEEQMRESADVSELSRDEVCQIAQTRTDCDR